jgi:hypothetical protein
VIDHVFESGIDRLGERPRPEDLLGSLDLLPIDDQRSLVRFGYLFGHAADIIASRSTALTVEG